MKKFTISTLTLLALVGLCWAQGDPLAQRRLDSIRDGKPNADQIKDLRVEKTATIGGAVTVGGALTVTGTTATGEARVDGKYAIVGGDAATGLMVLAGTCTNGQATATFATAFGAVPSVFIRWAGYDLSGVVAGTNWVPCAITITTSNFVPKVATWTLGTYTNMAYIAIGTRP